MIGKLLKKMIVGCVGTLLLGGAGTLGIAYVYQNQIVEQLVQSLNQYVATPVQVKSIKVSTWRSFPQLAVSFEEVSIPGNADSVLAATHPLADINRIDFSFDILALFQGNYELQQITLTDGSVTVLIDEQRRANYNVFRKQDSTQQKSTPQLAFRLEQVRLRNVQIRYLDSDREQDILTHADEITAALQVNGPVYKIRTEGELASKYIAVGTDHYFARQPLVVDARLIYYEDQDRLLIEPSLVSLHQAQISVQGLIDHSEETLLDLKTEATQSDFQTLLSVLPQALAKPWRHYRTEGEVQLAGQIKGPARQPGIRLSFGCENASFFHPDYRKKLENIYLSGSFSNGAEQNSRTADLQLNDIRATLDGKPLSGHLRLRNFRDLYLETSFQGEFHLQSLLAFYPIPQLKWAEGKIDADVQLAGKLSDLKSSELHRRRQTHSAGTIQVDQLAFALHDSQLPFQQISGRFTIEDNHLNIQRASGYWGHSHLAVDGQFNNAVAFALTKTHPVQIDASFHSDFMDLDELLSGQLSKSLTTDNLVKSTAQDWRTVADKQAYRLEISPRLTLNFSCDVKRLKFRRFRGQHIRGKLKLHNQIARIQDLSVQTAGGTAYASALVNAQREVIRTQGQTRLEGLHVDSIFYVFEDFQQDFLTARHLKGEVYATSDWRMSLNRNLEVRYPSLSVETFATLRKGELNNFEPMQRIARFVDEQELDHLRFGDIQNHILIRDQQIYIPRMLVHSNLSDIRVSGTHTFDNHIEYHFDVPMRSIHLRSAKARERTAQRKQHFGEVAPDDAAPTKLFLKARGTVDDYKISYDLPTAKAQLKENLVEEKKELKQVLKDKRKAATYEVELSDEYLEFEPAPQNQH